MRYWTQGTDARTIGALMPIMPVTARATTGGIVEIYGQPGTMGVPSPRPAATRGLVSQQGTTQPSSCAPDYIFPSIYYTTPRGMHPPVGLLRQNEMPVPAVGIYRLPSVLQRRRRTGGQQQVGQPAIVQRWAPLGTGQG